MNVTAHVELFVRRSCYQDMCQSLQTAIWKMARVKDADIFSSVDLQIKDKEMKTIEDYTDALCISGYQPTLNIFRNLHCKKIEEHGSEYRAPVLIYGLGEEITENPNATWRGPANVPPKISKNVIVIVLKKTGFHLSFLSEHGFDRVDEIFDAMCADLAITEMVSDNWLKDPNTSYYRCDRYIDGLLWNTSIRDRLILKTDAELLDMILEEFRYSTMEVIALDHVFDMIYPEDMDKSPLDPLTINKFRIVTKTKTGELLRNIFRDRLEQSHRPQPIIFDAMIKKHYWSLFVDNALKSH